MEKRGRKSWKIQQKWRFRAGKIIQMKKGRSGKIGEFDGLIKRKNSKIKTLTLEMTPTLQRMYFKIKSENKKNIKSPKYPQITNKTKCQTLSFNHFDQQKIPDFLFRP
jgi:hypothetical protein